MTDFCVKVGVGYIIGCDMCWMLGFGGLVFRGDFFRARVEL